MVVLENIKVTELQEWIKIFMSKHNYDGTDEMNNKLAQSIYSQLANKKYRRC